jgi:hypothetical protein
MIMDEVIKARKIRLRIISGSKFYVQFKCNVFEYRLQLSNDGKAWFRVIYVIISMMYAAGG